MSVCSKIIRNIFLFLLWLNFSFAHISVLLKCLLANKVMYVYYENICKANNLSK